MDPKHERTPVERPAPVESPAAPKKRFRIEKLEERIAPKGGKKTTNCASVSSGYGGGSIY